MNERIKELSKQAWESITVQDALNDEAFDQFDQKFAELIVKECAAEAHRRVVTEGNDNMIYAHLLEHFGVEE